MRRAHQETPKIPLPWRWVWYYALPRRRERVRLTFAGYILCLVAVGLTVAAYNNASNILFLALGFTLAMLGVSGVLAWMNFRKLSWKMTPPARLRVADAAPVRILLFNGKKQLPSYALRFVIGVTPGGEQGRVYFRDAVEPGSEVEKFWEFTPSVRGECLLKLDGVSSAHPFALIMKTVGLPLAHRAIVWPARVEYSFTPGRGRMLHREGDMHRKGSGSELIGLREYIAGDALRLVHWKASAKRGRLLVRETAEPGESGFSLRFDPGAFASGAGGASFEKACSFAGSLAEDLFHKGRLIATAVGAEPFFPVKRIGDVHAFLDRLAELQHPVVEARPGVVNADTLLFFPGPGDIVHVRLQDSILGEA